MTVGTGNNECDANPFTMVWCALWEMVERNENLTDLVRLANRIDYLVNPYKENISAADLPELALVSNGGTSNIMNSSGTSSFIRRYNWMISTGEWPINQNYYVLCWELYRAMIDWDVVLCALTWPDGVWNFIARANMLNIEEGTTMLSENRNIRGWAGIIGIDVEMHFRTSDLRLL